MGQRGDGDKLIPSSVSSSRGPFSFNSDQRNISSSMDDEDKLLDVVGPPQSPLLSLGQSLHQLHPHTHSSKYNQIWSYKPNYLIKVELGIQLETIIELIRYYFLNWIIYCS